MFRKAVKAIIPTSLFQQIEPTGHLVETVLANLYYGFPARNLKVIGVTGTDGKTTTTNMVWRMLVESGYKVGYMATTGYGTQDGEVPSHVHMTTMAAFPMLKRIKELKRDHGIEWLVLETTSHALAQNRVWGVPYQIGVMTNVNHEHLDYHKTFERYRDAKRRLFHIVNKTPGLKVGVVNAEDPSADLFAGDVANAYRYGVERGDIRATAIKAGAHGSTYKIAWNNRVLNITVNVPGGFNVYNSLATACVGFALGLSDTQIEKGIAALKGVEGRMATVDEGQDFGVIVDFAHTPDSFEKLLSDMASKTKKGNKLIVLFGSAGRRDETKRAIQGRIAGKYADLVIVTEEDDRDIDGNLIMGQIAGGAEESGKIRDKNLFLILDRPTAIKFAMSKAKSGDTIMLLGKGHEKTIERADGEHPWDEMAEARAAIKAVR